MTSWVVADSSILAATGLTEKYSEKAVALWQDWDAKDIQVAAPTLFRYEFVAIVRKHLARATISAEIADEALDRFFLKPVTLYFDEALLRRAYELAKRYNRPSAYDMQYIAVAEYLNCEFWTIDEKLYNALKGKVTFVRFIDEFVLPQNN